MNHSPEKRLDDRLSAKNKKLFKFLHVLFAGILMGGLSASLLLLWSGGESGRGDLLAALFPLIEILFLWSLTLSIATGLVLAFFGSWGMVRKTWVIVKWSGSSLLLLSYLFFLSPGVAIVVGRWDLNPEMDRAVSISGGLFASLGGSLFLALFLFYISFRKPWGHRKEDPVTGSPLFRKIFFVVVGLLLFYSGSMIYYFQSIRNAPPSARKWPQEPGIYRGSVKCAGGEYRAEVRIDERGRRTVELDSSHASLYFELAKGLAQPLAKAGEFPVDGVTGATTTSVCVLRSVRAALESTP